MLSSYTDSGYPAYINTISIVDPRFDGCIDATPATCVAIQLTDVNPETGEPVFAFLTGEQDTFKNYEFCFNSRIGSCSVTAGDDHGFFVHERGGAESGTRRTRLHFV